MSLNNSLCIFLKSLKKKSETPQIIFYPLNEFYPFLFPTSWSNVPGGTGGKKSLPGLWSALETRGFWCCELVWSSHQAAGLPPPPTLLPHGPSLGSEHTLFHTHLTACHMSWSSSNFLFLCLNISISIAPGVHFSIIPLSGMSWAKMELGSFHHLMPIKTTVF